LVELIQSKEDTPHSEDEFDELDPNDPASWQSLDYIHDQVQTQLNVQSGIWDAVDGRLRLILGVIRSSLPRLVHSFNAHPGRQGAPLPFSVGAATIVAVLLFLGAAAMVAWAYRPTDFDRPPKPGELRDLYLTTDPRWVKLTVIDSILDAYTGNEAVIKRKNRAFKWAFSLTAAGTGLLGLALMTQITCETSAPPWHALTWWAWPLGASGC